MNRRNLDFPDRNATIDEWQWLEDIYAEKALAWVDAQNATTTSTLNGDNVEVTSRQILEVLDSTDRIPMIAKHGDFYYNFWRDAEHPRGLWRRTTLDSYRTATPEWDVILDIDELGAQEDTEWVFAGAQMLFPDFTRALLHLSPDGGDAVVVREFDVEQRMFVHDGFTLPHAKTNTSWIDRDTIFVATDFGPGSMTTSSYPRQVKRWRRGESLTSADLVYEAPVDHMGVWADHDHTVGFERDIVRDAVDFFHFDTFIFHNTEPVKLDVPQDADVDLHREWLIIRPRSEWKLGDTTHPAGSLLAAKLDDWLAGNREVHVLFAPDTQTSLVDASWTRHHLMLTELRDVASRIEILTPGTDGWSRQDLGAVIPNQTVTIAPVDSDESDDYWLINTGFLTPSTLQLGTVGVEGLESLKASPAFFDASTMHVEQHFATSDDGTRIPYFQIGPKDLVLNGQTPTLLRGYGGFEIPQLPQYDGTMGRAWLEQGNVLVVANIRGGGEYGPTWHTSALREHRHRAYDDFAAVARDVIDRGVTSPQHLGCMGGSNGGLLVGNMLTHYPELFGAIVCLVPLLDMKRYTKLSAGTSWIAEYGDPDKPEDWAFIQTFSPYHNLRDGVHYPPVIFYTATSDDRVGPVQARKMAARMQERGIPNVLFYENRQGGHAGSADNAQRAHMLAMGLEFLKEHVG